VHFESDATKAKFDRKPIKFLNMLSLEPAVDGSVKLVDASDYQDAVTEFCPFMPESEVDPHGTVYILHRGWKFYFCCWTGCGDYFMQDPAAAYDWYGLVERDGKLVRKAGE
jgi:YHS domain-containing protein